jgi:hypothetical protein
MTKYQEVVRSWAYRLHGVGELLDRFAQTFHLAA